MGLITYHVVKGTGHCDIGDGMKLLFKEYAVRELTKED